MNACLHCGTLTRNIEFCCGACRKKFNQWSSECEHSNRKRLSFRGLRG